MEPQSFQPAIKDTYYIERNIINKSWYMGLNNMKLNKEFSNLINEILKYKGTDEKSIILKKYIKLILVMARKYVRGRADYSDIASEGIRGLLEAHKHFDPSRSTYEDKDKAFKIYAITRMRGRMFEYCLANTRPVHIPIHVAKALSYVEKMIKLLNKEPILFRDNICSLDIIRKFNHPVEDKIDPRSKKKLRRMKERINNLAANSMTQYETLVGRAILGLVSEVREEDLDAEYCKVEHDKDELAGNTEFLVFMSEQEAEMLRILGERKLFTLKMRVMGYNHQEIAEALYEKGYTDHIISRQAVRGSIDAAKDKLQRSRLKW